MDTSRFRRDLTGLSMRDKRKESPPIAHIVYRAASPSDSQIRMLDLISRQKLVKSKVYMEGYFEESLIRNPLCRCPDM